MVQSVSPVDVLEVGPQPLVEKDVLELLEAEVVLLPDQFDQRHLVQRVDVVDGAPEGPQQLDEAQLSAQGGVKEGGGAVDVEDVGGESVFEEVLHAGGAFEVMHFWVADEGEAVVGLVEDAGLGVPHAEEVEGSASLGVLEVEVGIDPLHEDPQQVG